MRHYGGYVITFYRSSWQDLWLRITSDEPLGVLDTAYKEDYFGNDGYLSVLHIASGERFFVPMQEAPQSSKDNFIGSLDLQTMPDGYYQVEGRVRDTLGNYTILSAFDQPFGNERVIPLLFRIQPGQSDTPSVGLNLLVLTGGITLDLSVEPASPQLLLLGVEQAKPVLVLSVTPVVPPSLSLGVTDDTPFLNLSLLEGVNAPQA